MARRNIREITRQPGEKRINYQSKKDPREELDIDLDDYEEPYYKNEDLLRKLYVGEKMDSAAIANVLDAENTVVAFYLDDFGIALE